MFLIRKNQGKSEHRVLAFNMLWSIIAVVINYGITFFVTPFVTNTSGAEAYGFVNLANTFSSYIDVIAIALNAFACRFISIAFHKGEYKEAKRYFNSVIIADAILSIGLFGICSTLILRLDYLLNISDGLIADVKILFALVLIRYIISIMTTAFSIGTFIKNRIDLSERQKSISYILQGGLLLVLFALLPTHIWYIGCAALVAIIWLFGANVYYTKKLTPELTLDARDFSIKYVRDLLSAGIWNAINNFGNILNSGLDLLITNLMLNGTAMGQVSIGKSLGTMFNALLESITNAFRPKLLQFYAEGKTERLVKELKYAMRVTGTVSNIIFAGFVSCGFAFMKLWVPTQETSLIYIIAVIVLLSDIIIGVIKPLYYVFTLTNHLKLPCLVTILMGICNVVSMYFLLKFTNIGIYAVVLTTLILNYVHFFDTPIYSAYCLKIKLTTFYGTIVRHFISCFLTTGVMMLVAKFLPEARSWTVLAFNCAVCGIFGSIVAIISVLNKEDVQAIRNKVTR